MVGLFFLKMPKSDKCMIFFCTDKIRTYLYYIGDICLNFEFVLRPETKSPRSNENGESRRGDFDTYDTFRVKTRRGRYKNIFFYTLYIYIIL